MDERNINAETAKPLLAQFVIKWSLNKLEHRMIRRARQAGKSAIAQRGEVRKIKYPRIVPCW